MKKVMVSLLFLVFNVMLCASDMGEQTDEPIPSGPFITIPMHIENIQLVDSHDLYRKWTYDRVMEENRGVGTTYNLLEFFLDSPVTTSKYQKYKVNIRVEPHQKKKVPGFTWIDGGKKHTVNDLHVKVKGIYYGVDDQGKPVKAEYQFTQ